MKKRIFNISGEAYEIDVQGSSKFAVGEANILSTPATDITSSLSWYDSGYKTSPILNRVEMLSLKEGLKECIKRILSDLGVNNEGFELEKYHHYVTSNETHFKVVSITRDLFPPDFNFPIENIVKRLEKAVGFGLTDREPISDEQWHIIIRINRPGSTDYNPPHKDFYGPWDKDRTIFRFMNLWIPICGVTEKSSLPIVPGSHLLPESKILRTREGGVIGGNSYRVRNLIEWDGKNDLERAVVSEGEVLMFSSHLIHGLAVNDEEDTTRMALEFRLFKKENKE